MIVKQKQLKSILNRAYREYVTPNNIVIAVAVIITISWIWASIGVMQRNFALQAKVESIRKQVSLHELESQNLTYLQEYYKSREYIELEAKRRLGKALPGERVLLLPANSKATKKQTDSDTPQTNRSVKQSNFSQWMEFLFDKK